MSADRIIIFDTTLRDGEQSPGCSMNLAEKLRMAELLDTMGVDIIEAGFPIASKGDFEAVLAIAGQVKNSVVCGLARAKPADIDTAGDALKPAVQRRIHTFISTSPIHMQYQLQMSPDAVLAAVTDSVRQARGFTDDVEWSAMDATRSELDFLCNCVEAAIKAGATTINLPDTVGFALPDEIAAMVFNIRTRVPDSDRVIFSMHCHNDLGLAVANSLAGVKAGARQIECTINGIGERAGNAALEEIVMALKVRGDLMPFTTGVDATMISQASRTLSSITGFNVQPNKAIVGANAFAHESGIHQDGVLKHAGTYEIMTPESVGLIKSNLVLGKHSGRHAFKSKLQEMGYELGDNAFQEIFTRFKDLADHKKEIFDEDIAALVDEHAVQSTRTAERVQFVGLTVQAGSHGPQVADLELTVDGIARSSTARGNGPVDALFTAIRDIHPHDGVTLALFKVHAVTGGTDAQARVTVQLTDQQGVSFNGQSADADTMVASCMAYLHALNRLIAQEGRATRRRSGP